MNPKQEPFLSNRGKPIAKFGLFLASCVLLALVCGQLRAADANPFFAMNTAAPGQPAEVVPLLKELGYAGLGGTAGDGAMATALE